jgi:hypothetical protein
MLGFHTYFEIWHNWDSRFVSTTLWPHFILREIPWQSFLLECECTPGLLNADRRSLGNFPRTLNELHHPRPREYW